MTNYAAMNDEQGVYHLRNYKLDGFNLEFAFDGGFSVQMFYYYHCVLHVIREDFDFEITSAPNQKVGFKAQH